MYRPAPAPAPAPAGAPAAECLGGGVGLGLALLALRPPLAVAAAAGDELPAGGTGALLIGTGGLWWPGVEPGLLSDRVGREMVLPESWDDRVTPEGPELRFIVLAEGRVGTGGAADGAERAEGGF